MRLTYDHYYGYDELTQALQAMTVDHAGLAVLSSIGKSNQGRDIWCVTLTNQATGEAGNKPAMYIDANHHAGELVGSMVALYTVDYLLSNYGACPRVTRLLDTTAFYVIPRVTPDGAEHYLTTPDSLRSVPRHYPFLDWEEREGLRPEDIDGDGQILLMRVKDPAGEWKASALDPRAMAVRRPDEHGGEYYRLFPEGRIHEFDGIAVKAAPARYGIDLNRNYPNDWVVEAQQAGSGPHPLSEAESRAMAAFVTAHINIAAGITHHTSGGALLLIPGSRDPRSMPAGDMEALKLLAGVGSELTGFPAIGLFDGFHVDKGKFNRGAYDEWLYLHRGIISFTSELWNLAVRAGVKVWPRVAKTHEEQEQDFVKMLQWTDQELQGTAFEPWRPFDHPQLGPVEIGGWKAKWYIQNAPPRFLAAECHKLTQWELAVADALPHLTLRDVTVRAVAGTTDLYQVSCGVYSTGYLPTSGSDYARDIKLPIPFTVQLETAAGAAEIIGPAKHELTHLPGRCGAGGLFMGYAPGPRTPREVKASWVVRAPAGTKAQIVAATPRAGTARIELTLG